MSAVRNMDEIDEAEEEALLKSDDEENNDTKEVAKVSKAKVLKVKSDKEDTSSDSENSGSSDNSADSANSENSDNSDSSDNSDDSDDSENSDDSHELDGSKAKMELTFTDLFFETTKNCYNYDNHLKLVEMAYKLADLDKLRKSHQLFSKYFPLAPDIWLKYLAAESSLATTPTEIENVKILFSKALKDYYSVDVAFKFAEFIMSHAVAEKEEIWNEILSTYGIHTMEGRKLFALYRIYNENTNTGRDQKNQVLIKSYLRELKIPLFEMEESYIEFKLFNEKNATKIPINWKEIDKHYNRSKGHLKKFLPFENGLALLNKKQYRERTELYLKYIKDADDFANENILQTLYERMITECCLNPESWNNYISFIESRDRYSRPRELENLPVFNQTILDISARSIRNCTWNVKFYLYRFNLLEKFNKTKADFQELLETGLSVNFQKSEYDVNLWLSYLSYLKRNTNYNNEEECDILRKTFDLCWTSLGSKWGPLADCNCEILLFWGRLEYGPLKFPEKGKDLWTVAMESSDNSLKSALWIEFIHLEMSRNPESAAKLFQKALKIPRIDNPHILISIWKRFEYCNGTLKQSIICHKFCESILNDIGKIPKNPYEKPEVSAKSNLKRRNEPEQAKVNNKESTDVTFKKPFPKEPHSLDSVPAKKVKVDAVSKNLVKEHENDEIDVSKDHIRIFLSNLDYNITEEDIREGLPELQISSIDLIKTLTGKNRGFGYAELINATEVEKALLYDRRLLKGRPVYISSVLRDKENRQKFKYSGGLEPKKIFVKGLPFDISKGEVEIMFKKFGTLQDVRLVYHKSGKFKGIAYIEFEEEHSASAAVLGLDQHNIRGSTIIVAISAPPPKSMVKPPVNSRILGGGNPRNKTLIGEQKARMTLIPTSVRKQQSKNANLDVNVATQDKPKSNEDFRKMLMK